MFGERIKQARELSGLTQADLAQKIGMRQSTIAQIEAGAYLPSESVLEAIAIHTGFELGFLRQDKPPAEFPIGSFLYRSQAGVSSKDKARAHRAAQLMFEIAELMRAQLKNIPVLLPRTSEPSEIAAQIVRASLGFSPESVIPNLLNAVERAGVMILNLPLEIKGLDGFSAWVGTNHDIPIICLISGKLGYRKRFTLAEEICHLVKHNPLRCTVKDADEEARHFVGELLLPEEVMRDEITSPVTLSGLVSSREKHRVSLQFLIGRIFDLGIVSQNQYRYLMMQVSSRGWRTKEPGDEDVPQEQPRMFAKMVEVVYGNPPNFTQMKRDMCGTPVSLLRSLLGHSLSPPDPSGPGRKILSFQKKVA
jgi:Zn-dependent peptidase ImmA (M78 family)/transcriptional regulator with XRE-family HTH domain